MSSNSKAQLIEQHQLKSAALYCVTFATLCEKVDLLAYACSCKETRCFSDEPIHKRLATFPMMDGYAVDVTAVTKGG